MWIPQFLVFILAFQVTHQKSPFAKFGGIYDSQKNYRNLFHQIAVELQNEDHIYKMYFTQSNMCAALNSTSSKVVDYLLKAATQINNTFTKIMTGLDTAFDAGREFHAASEAVLQPAIADIHSIRNKYDKFIELIRDLTDVKDAAAYAQKVNSFMNSVFSSTSLHEAEFNEILSRIHGSLYKDSSSHLLSQLLNHNSLMDRCSNFETMQHIMYYTYLQLLSTEIRSFYLISFGYFFDSTHLNFNNINAMLTSTTNRIDNYVTLIHNTILEAGPKCQCQLNPLVEVQTKPFGVIEKFYPVPPAEDGDEDTKSIRFYTNVSENICVHLSTSPTLDKVVYEICLGTRIKSENLIRKYGEVVHREMTDDATRFYAIKHRRFSIQWMENLLMVSREVSDDESDLLLTYENDPDLNYIKYFAVTSPHSVRASYWYLTNGLPQEIGFSSIIRGIKSCYCKLEDANHNEGSFFALEDHGSINVCRVSMNGEYECTSSDNDDGITYTDQELISILRGCKPDSNKVHSDLTVSNQYASLQNREVKFFKYCSIDDDLGVYSEISNKCQTITDKSGIPEILSI